MTEARDTPASWDIADLARELDISSRTIRYYGELGLLPAAGRGPGGRRRYGPDAPARLRFIARLKRLGLTLEQIGELDRAFDRGQTPSMLERLDTMLDEQLSRVETRIEELSALGRDLRNYRDRIRSKRGLPAGRPASTDSDSPTSPSNAPS